MVGRLTQKDGRGNWNLKGVLWEELHSGIWHGNGSISGVIAWMPLPEPFQVF